MDDAAPEDEPESDNEAFGYNQDLKAESAAAQYSRILARKYAVQGTRSLTAEESARLEIAKQRVRDLVLAVTTGEAERLGEILSEVQSISVRHREIAKRLGRT